MSERAAPFYCPYCAEENLRPFGEAHGQWRCGACRRVFTLRYVGSAFGADSQTGVGAEGTDTEGTTE